MFISLIYKLIIVINFRVILAIVFFVTILFDARFALFFRATGEVGFLDPFSMSESFAVTSLVVDWM
ncbi:hypothetical protein B9J93_19015 [Vibrio sp. V17_P4S1T151]|nr:hypothetical protein B9J93_19015 [Vibrio sp. V17_P4S1T151]OXX62801.1 hypothetical protein B9J89_08795 [Vibrio sp. V15_P4S5T153]OXX69436.1 hypothetical protein B9J94_05895 [Vibrio sp. V20_P4S3T152]